MSGAGTLILFLCIGAVVATSMALVTPDRGGPQRVGRLLIWLTLWPFFAPGLLAAAMQGRGTPGDAAAPGRDQRVAASVRDLLDALDGLDGVAEEVLAPERARVRALGASMERAARRVSELEAVLDSPGLDAASLRAELAQLDGLGAGPDDPRRASLESRLRNVGRLTAVCDQHRAELDSALFHIEEMRTQVLLLRFGERPRAELVERLRELSVQISGATEGLMEVG